MMDTEHTPLPWELDVGGICHHEGDGTWKMVVEDAEMEDADAALAKATS